MEYEFDTDPRGRPQAHFSMDHEAFGHWFSSELGSNAALIAQLTTQVQRLKQRRAGEYRHPGHEYDLYLDADEVRVASHCLSQLDDELDDALHYDHSQAAAGCGLEDFEAVLAGWREFIGQG